MSGRVGGLMLLLVATVFPAGALAAQTPPATCRVEIRGDVPSPGTFDLARLRTLPAREVRAADHGKKPAAYAGARVSDVLGLAGVKLGPGPRGAGVRQYLLVTAADGYGVLFSVAELDSALTDREVLFIHTRDGRTLDAEEGPCRIVAPGDKRHARWVRQVTTLEFHKVP